MSSKWECNFCGEILPKGPCVYINPVAKCHPGLCPMDHDKHAPWVAAQKEKEEAKPSASDNTSSPKLPSLMECAEKLLGGKLTSYPPTDYSDGMKDMYNFLVGNFGLR